MASLLNIVVSLTLGFAPPVWNASQTGYDERTLGVNASPGPVVIDRFRANMLTPEEVQQVRTLIDRLGSNDYHQREAAQTELKFWKAGAEYFLTRHEHDANLERRRRVRQLLDPGLGRWSAQQAEAAARLLRKSPSAEAVKALVDYLPFEDNAGVRMEIAATLRDFAGQNADFASTIRAAIHRQNLDALFAGESKAELSPTLLALERARGFFAHVAQNDVEKLTEITRLPFALGNGVILHSPDQRDDFFKQAIANYRQANRHASLAFLHVTRLEEHFRFADEPERGFLLQFPADEIRVVHVRVRRDWQNEETGTILVHVGAQAHVVIGLGQSGLRVREK